MKKPSFVYTTLRPAMYHGFRMRAPYFEGWYYKLVSADETHRFAVIPGVILGEAGHAFVQVLDGVRGTAAYHSFPLSEFHPSTTEFDLRIAQNHFTTYVLELNLDSPAGRTSGRLRFDRPRPWPVTWLSPGIMGWYAWMPAMECYHGVLSFDHAIEGRLEVDGRDTDFGGGRGYMEKDWGQSFPEAYVWLQTNHFERPGVCLTASVAIIPWRRSAFPGFIIGLWVDGHLYRFATYTRARLERLSIDDRHVIWSVHDRKHRLEMTATRAEAGLIKGPSKLEMGRRIDETLRAEVTVRMTKRDGKIVFTGTGRHAGLEVYQPDRLLGMIHGPSHQSSSPASGLDEP